MQMLEDLVIAGTDTVVVDDDPAVLGRLRGAGIRTVRGDAADRDVLVRAGADHARVIVSTIRRPRDNEGVLAVAPRVPALVRVFDDADADWGTERGGTAVLCTEASTEALMDRQGSSGAGNAAQRAEAPGRPGDGEAVAGSPPWRTLGRSRAGPVPTILGRAA